MTDRERFAAQMHHRPVDRCFNMEFGYWNENFAAWRLFRDHGITSNAEADLLLAFDRIEVFSGTTWMSPWFEEKVIAETATTLVMVNQHGLIAEVPRDGHDTIPHFLRASIRTPDDWKRAKEERFDRRDPARRVDVAALAAEHPRGRDYPLGVHCGSLMGRIRDMLTFEGLAYAIYDYPTMLEDMVETACVLVEDMLDQVLPKIDFDFASGWEDICYKSGPIVSMDFFRDVVLPRCRRIGARLAAAGIDLWYTDCDGDVRPLVPGWLDAGLNTMFPFEVNCSGPPGELLDRFAPGLRIMGGVDKLQIARGPEAIDRYLGTLEPYVARGGFIPFIDHDWPPGINPEHYLYYLDAKRRHFGA